MKYIPRLTATVTRALGISFIAATATAQTDTLTSIRTEAIVTVYSNGEVIKRYKAVNDGEMDGDCFVFRIRKGVREPEVRVCGTFTVEGVD